MPAEASAPRRFSNWRQALAVYRDKRQLVIFFMGFSSGLPLLLTLSTLSFWLAKVGVDKTTIGIFALVGLPYTLKFLWSPIIDHIPVPILTSLLGRRRSWALAIQSALVLSILFMGQTDPVVDPWWTALAALLIAFFSASQDIVIDAYRIDILDNSDEEQGAGSASTQAGYRFGLIAAGAGAIALSDFIGWPTIFAILAGLMGVGMLTVVIADEPSTPPRPFKAVERGDAFLEALRDDLNRTVVAPFMDFFSRRAAIVTALFVLLYKFGDAIGGVMAYPFYVEVGFSGVEIASISKVFGVIVTLAGIAVGGLMVTRYGIFFGLLVGGILQAVANLLFSLQAMIGHDLVMLTVAIGGDNFSGGLASAAFVAYLSRLCNRHFTATQYALLTSLMAFGRTVMSSGGGWLADQLDWVTFFALTTVIAVPGMLLLFLLVRLGRGSPIVVDPNRS
ncbi:MAG: AmpG family muropeptide MFS transporter [Kiloniellales bacterium]